MLNIDRSRDAIMSALEERAKELNCLYEVEKALTGPGRSVAK